MLLDGSSNSLFIYRINRAYDYLCILLYIIWALVRENLSSGFVNKIGGVKPVYPRRLISAFVIYFLDSIISGEIFSF